MKKIILWVFCLVSMALTSSAQIEQPVHWSYGTKKLSGDIIEVHLLATIDNDWHIYAQKQPEGAIAIPTKISFVKGTSLTLIGQPAELGKKERYTVKEADITNDEYAGKVDFVQKIKVRPGTKEVKGSIVFQACTHQRCLPEDTINFTVSLP